MKKTIIFFIASIICLFNINAQQISVPKLLEYVMPAVVQVFTDEAQGSGVIINLDGYIITNYHVIESALKNNSGILIRTHDKDEYEVKKIIDYDDDLDLAILKTVPLPTSIALHIVNPDSVLVGEDVVCVGSPLGLQDYVTKGIISKYNTPYVFMTASINPGNSGGALVNLKGELVGIPTLASTNLQTMNIAICPRSILYMLKTNKIKYNK